MNSDLDEILCFMKAIKEAKLDCLTAERVKKSLWKTRTELKYELENYSEDIGSAESIAISNSSKKRICEINCHIKWIDIVVEFVDKITLKN